MQHAALRKRLYLIENDAPVRDSLETPGEVVGFSVHGYDCAEGFLGGTRGSR